MRIGIDMLGAQSPESRGRGIGRYARSLVSALVALDATNEYRLYSHHGLPDDASPDAPNAEIVALPPDRSRAEAIEAVARGNPDRLDVLLLSSPFELGAGYRPPARPIDGPAMAAVVYDFVAFVFQEKYLTDPPSAMGLYRSLERLRRYDRLLAISEATRADALRRLGLPGERVANIRGASDPAFFTPGRSEPMPGETEGELRRLGIDRPFVFCLAGLDERKNLVGLLDAFRLLSEPLRSIHQLVIAYGFSAEDEARVRRLASERGILDSLVLAGPVEDVTLRRLYRRCAAFAMPSLYEGFGLPLLEAMHCGAAVVGGNNSSQVEVVGRAGLLANAQDPADIASAIGRILGDAAFADRLRAEAPEQARRFTWADTARRTLDALRGAAATSGVKRGRRAGRERPRVAVFSPWPPKGSGISDYSLRLVADLRRHFALDLYHDSGYEPDLGACWEHYGAFDHRLFERNARIRGYRGVLYHMGNSSYHGFIYEAIRKHPGVVMLHDWNLSGFHLWRAYRQSRDVLPYFRDEIEANEPERAGEIIPRLPEWAEGIGLREAFVRHGVPLCRRVVEAARAVIVHSAWGRDRVAELGPDYLDRTFIIPHGSDAATLPPGRREAIRRRFGLPGEAMIVASFGILHPQKMNVEALRAFAQVAREVPSALFLFVGQDLDADGVRAEAERLGLRGRVRFLGRQPADAFSDLLAVPDVGLNLRRPPTNGETSGALLHLLRHGIPTIVTDVGTFADYPDDVVRKVRWEAEGQEGLARALRELVVDPSARERLGSSAMRHVLEQHAWERVAALYAEVIERVAALGESGARRAIA